MFLPILVVLIFLPLSEGRCNICPSCCDAGIDSVDGEITKCYEQRAGLPCSKHFYIVEISGGERNCINPDSQWLREKREENLKCPPAH